MTNDGVPALADFETDGWELDDGEALNRESPSTFRIPPLEERSALSPGNLVKLIFRIRLRDGDMNVAEEVERMWVIVKGRHGHLYEGVLDNDPYCSAEIRSGMPVFFETRHVIAIYEDKH
jgi:hypothetical protein